MKERSEPKMLKIKVVGKGLYWGYGSGQKAGFLDGLDGTVEFHFGRRGAIRAEPAAVGKK